MESWCEPEDLYDLIRECQSKGTNLSEKFVWKVLYQTARALLEAYCHSVLKKVTVPHWDIKPKNILLDKDYNIKLDVSDDLATILQHNVNISKNSFVGTSSYYMSPDEQFRGLIYKEKSDVWSMGCLIYELCCLIPFEDSHHNNRVQNRLYISRIPLRYSDGLHEMVKLLLSLDPEYRPSSVEAIAHHPTVIRNYDANAEPFDLESHVGNGDNINCSSDSFKPITYPKVVKGIELGSEGASDVKLNLRRQQKLLQQREFALQAKEYELAIKKKLFLRLKEVALWLHRKRIWEARERNFSFNKRKILDDEWSE